MLTVLIYIGFAILAALGLLVVVAIMWFVVGMILGFYKIYLKPKPKKSKCEHKNWYLTGKNFEKPFTCFDCGDDFVNNN